MYKNLRLLDLQRLDVPDFIRVGHDRPVRAKFAHLSSGVDRLLNPLRRFLRVGVINHLLCLQVYNIPVGQSGSLTVEY
jgi:hypothetical protein